MEEEMSMDAAEATPLTTLTSDSAETPTENRKSAGRWWQERIGSESYFLLQMAYNAP